MRKTLIAVIAGAAFLLALACGAAPDAGKPVTAAGTPPKGEPASTVVYSIPAPADFSVKVVELSRKCFGSAGCNVTFTVELRLVTAAVFDPAKTYRVTYAVGGSDDAYTNYAKITNGRYEADGEEFVSVKKQSTPLTATITQIVES